ncbi:MAG: DUF5522 domain-containing protein [Actinomycetota bacterium]
MPERLPDDPVWRRVALRAHEAAVEAGSEGYVDPVTGLLVMTEAALRRRGTCCGQGCRHCPY